jgi:hypothetical protein
MDTLSAVRLPVQIAQAPGTIVEQVQQVLTNPKAQAAVLRWAWRGRIPPERAGNAVSQIRQALGVGKGLLAFAAIMDISLFVLTLHANLCYSLINTVEKVIKAHE